VKLQDAAFNHWTRTNKPPVEFISIPAGHCLLGDARVRDTSPQHRFTIHPFAIGKFPVTNSDYPEFIAARGYEAESCWTVMGWKWQRGRLGQEPAPAFWHEPRLNLA